jgi:glutathione reductase (NADPH)
MNPPVMNPQDPPMETYDLLILGGGSGGLAVAEKAAAYGATVALFDPKPLGGTCVNEGCVPKKLTWYAAHHLSQVRHAHEFAVHVREEGFEYPELVRKRHAFLAMLNDYWSGYLQRLGVRHIPAMARIVAPYPATQNAATAQTAALHVVEADGRRYGGTRLVVATGGEPVLPRLPGHELGSTSDDFFQWETLPRSIAIIGAGYIGLEMAGMLRAFGVEVSVIAMEARILEMFDPMVSEVLDRHMAEQGIARHLGAAVEALSGEPGAVWVHTANGQRHGPFARVLWAVGRRPKTRGIGLEEAGVEILANHTLPVDAWGATRVAGIFALGDILGKAALTPVAIAAGRRLADRWYAPEKRPEPVDYTQIPTVTFTHPPTAAVGLTEPQAVAQYGDTVRVYATEYGGLARAFATGAIAPVAMKLICAGAEKRIVGLHMVGENVDEMLQGFAVAVRMGATKRDFDLTIPLHPTSAEELVTLKEARHGQS